MSSSPFSGGNKRKQTTEEPDVQKKLCLEMNVPSSSPDAGSNKVMDRSATSARLEKECTDTVIEIPELDQDMGEPNREIAETNISSQPESMEDVEESFIEQDEKNTIEESTSFDEEEEDDLMNVEESEQNSWQGTSLEDIVSTSLLSELPRVHPSHYHKVLYKVPWKEGCVPKPEPQDLQDSWIKDHVRMPYSQKSKFPVRGVPNTLCNRWEMIKDALEDPIVDSAELEAAIKSYNHTYGQAWDFSLLHFLLNEEFDPRESDAFFKTILPGIIELALRLPSLVTQPIPLLLSGESYQLSLSQLQIASLLANAFLCTFPRRNSTAQRTNGEFSNFPDINFCRLYKIPKGRPLDPILGKLRCIINYFRRVCTETPVGTVTFSRRFMKREAMPAWKQSNKKLTRLHVSSTGTIEDNGVNMLQVDFANCIIGGGVLATGCVQEEIRFVICPELIVARLFTERLDDTEALVISGVEQFSSYQGYARTFAFTGNYQDQTARDGSGRRYCSIVAIDALNFSTPIPQFYPAKIIRELNKAYVGFQTQEPFSANAHSTYIKMPVATGNWGCGAFQGDKYLKAVIQLLAAAHAGRDVVYFTFRDRGLRDELANLHSLLVEHSCTVAEVFQALVEYSKKYIDGERFSCSLYNFLHAKFTPGATLPDPPKPKTIMANFLKQTKKETSQGYQARDEPPHDKQRKVSSEEVVQMVYGDQTDDNAMSGSSLNQEPSTSRDKTSFENVLDSDTPDTKCTEIQSLFCKDELNKSHSKPSIANILQLQVKTSPKVNQAEKNGVISDVIGSSTIEQSDLTDNNIPLENNENESISQKSKITDYFQRKK